MTVLAEYDELHCSDTECNKLIGYIKKENGNKPETIQLCQECGLNWLGLKK